jgi:hypothetical protein
MDKRNRTYIRFVCYQVIASQRQRLGLFQAIDAARSADDSPAWAVKQIGETYGWFQKNLAVPKQFSQGGWHGHGQPGLSWFKPVATQHIFQMHQMKLALEACGVHVDILTTRDPGQIVWQDEHQIVAEPGTRKF